MTNGLPFNAKGDWYVSLVILNSYSYFSVQNYYHPRMRVGNVFGHVCLSVCLSVCVCVCLCVCLSVCVSVCLSVQAITFEPLNIETSFLVCRYILTKSRSSLSIKVFGSRSRPYEKK